MKYHVPRSPFAMPLSGSAREVELRIRNIVQGPKKRPPAWFLVLVFCAILSCGWLVSCQPMEKPHEGPAPSTTQEPELLDTMTQENLDLDGSGENDDTITVSCYARSESHPNGLATVQATLGTGEALTWEHEGSYVLPELYPLHLTTMGRQTVIVSLQLHMANWDGADYYVLQVEDGALVELGKLLAASEDPDSLAPYPALHRSPLLAPSLPDDGPLDKFRFAMQYLDKGNVIYGTLLWNGSVLAVRTGSTFYTTLDLPPEAEQLQIDLSGPTLDDPDLYYDLKYDRISIFNRDGPLQTITPYDVPADQRLDWPANGRSRCHDINFDGLPDLGISCSSSENFHLPFQWFLFYPEEQYFRYSLTLSGDTAIDEENRELLEIRNTYDHMEYNVYRPDSQGNLTLVQSQQGDGTTLPPRFSDHFPTP